MKDPKGRIICAMDLQEYYECKEVIEKLITCQVPHSYKCDKVCNLPSWRSAVACSCNSNEIRTHITDLAKIMGICEIE